MFTVARRDAISVSSPTLASAIQGLNQFRRSKLHWLDVDDRVRFMVCVHVLMSAQHSAWIPVVTLPTGV